MCRSPRCRALSSPTTFFNSYLLLFFFFNDTATTEIYTLSLHDALPISGNGKIIRPPLARNSASRCTMPSLKCQGRSEEHTSELQSLRHLVCRLLLEKKKPCRRCRRRAHTRRGTGCLSNPRGTPRGATHD